MYLGWGLCRAEDVILRTLCPFGSRAGAAEGELFFYQTIEIASVSPEKMLNQPIDTLAWLWLTFFQSHKCRRLKSFEQCLETAPPQNFVASIASQYHLLYSSQIAINIDAQQAKEKLSHQRLEKNTCTTWSRVDETRIFSILRSFSIFVEDHSSNNFLQPTLLRWVKPCLVSSDFLIQNRLNKFWCPTRNSETAKMSRAILTFGELKFPSSFLCGLPRGRKVSLKLVVVGLCQSF